MGFLPDNPDPSQGNQILRAGSGKAYLGKRYVANLLAIHANLSLPANASDGPHLAFNVDGSIVMSGFLDASSTFTNGDTLFTVSRKILSPNAIHIEGGILSGVSTVPAVGTSFFSVFIEVVSSAVSDGYCDFIFRNLSGTSFNKLYLDNLAIYPAPV
ncbi:MAG: hypothetical protein JKY48_02485 [Flavobacteriales bacterium]|nr:hypothetical protein [Flavobacteriales bacterium]